MIDLQAQVTLRDVQIAQLAAELSVLRRDNEQLRHQVADGQATVEFLQTDLAGTQSELSLCQLHVVELQEQVKALGQEPRPRPDPKPPAKGRKS
jgi:chromosome segregation ATPase